MQPAEQGHKWSYVLDQPTRILIVDDDPILREFASVYLSTPVAQVTTAPDAETGLELLSTNSFDIALFDIEMPGMNGFELVERVRAQERLRSLPIVMLTSREDIASIDRAFSVGATSFATKPVNWRLLSYQLRYVMRASRTDASAAGASVPIATDPNALAASELVRALQSILRCAHAVASADDFGKQREHAREIAESAENLVRKLSQTGN